MTPLDRLSWLRLVAASDVSAGALRVAITIAWRLNMDAGNARPSVAGIATDTGMDPRTVQRGARVLEVVGLLTVEHPAGRSCCTYAPANPGSAARVEPRQECQGSGAPTPAIPSINPGNSCRQPRQFVSPTPAALPPEQGQNRDRTGTDEQGRADSLIGMDFITKDGKPWRLTPADHRKLVEAHPSLDVDAELARAALWCEANPAKRKTGKGMLRFLAGWLGRANPSEPVPAPMRRLDVPDPDDDVVDRGLVPVLGRLYP